MQIGSYEIPENRLIPNAIADAKKLFDSVKHDSITTKDMGGIFAYKNYTTGIFYRRLNSMLSYGLLDQVGRGNFKVSTLGEGLAYPENDQKEKELKTKAVLSVQLWNEIYKKHGRHPPTESFWVLLKNITGIDPAEAQKIQSLILKWYNEDISNVHDDLVEQKEPQTQSLSFGATNGNQVSQQIVQSRPSLPTSSTHELIQFGEVSLSLPKKDLRKQWAKLQKYMEIYLEDYTEESVVMPQEELAPESQTN